MESLNEERDVSSHVALKRPLKRRTCEGLLLSSSAGETHIPAQRDVPWQLMINHERRAKLEG
jgi:hypothetical protein